MSIPIPPAEVRYRIVNRDEPVQEFLDVGLRCKRSIEGALAAHGLAIRDFQRVLDFGCGCGRILRHFESLFESVEFTGTDIDEIGVRWCKENIDGVVCTVNDALPPLDFPDQHFDFIYGLSVFTHLDESFQTQWLNELRRVSRPGAVLLLTTHGRFVLEQSREHLRDEDIAGFESRGFLFVRNILDGVLPDWYQTAFHSEEYLRRTFGRYFEILEFLPQGMDNFQDAILLSRTT